jgi:uncharacterized membrane protein
VSEKSLIFLLGLVLGVIFAMGAFVVHDQILDGLGKYEVVSVSAKDLEVRLLFPSGHEESFTLGRQIHRFRVSDTGEGSITAFVNGVNLGSRGYVTHVNQPYLLVVGQDHFSMHFAAESPAFR